MDKSWMSPVAGILDVISGVLGLIGCFALICVGLLMGRLAIEEQEVPLFVLESLFVGVSIGLLILAVLAIVGGSFALRRSRWGWMVTGAIAATILCPPLGVAAVILTVLSERELAA